MNGNDMNMKYKPSKEKAIFKDREETEEEAEVRRQNFIRFFTED